MNGSVATFWSLADWAEAVAALPVTGPLPCRTVLVPGEPVAHALRRVLVESGRAAVLAGTRFVTLGEAATAVLRAAGVAFEPGEDDLRPVRLLGLFAEPLRLEYFSADLLRDRPGWDLALARAVADLEAAALRPEALEAADEPRLRDVARFWRWLDARAGRSWTAARVVAEAADLLAGEPGRWPYPGPTLAAVTGHESRVEARLVRAVPDLALGVLAARPLRERHLEQVEALYGEAARRALLRPAPRPRASERDLLAAYLFEPPPVLADPDRPRSPGPDDTVRLEEHAGVEAELEATADWVAEQVADGTPLEDIAVLLPSLDPLAALVAARLARLPWPGATPPGAPGSGSLPVHVAGGLPLVSTAAGARALAVVRALAAHLSGEALAEVLPALRTAADEADDTAPRHLTHGEAMELVWSLGTPGGNPAHPAGALDWPERLAAREPALEALLARARAARDDPERSGLARTARDLERLLASLRAARPAVEALAGVARLVVAGAPLGDLWPALRDFLATWLLQPGPGPRVEALLDERLGPLAAVAGPLAGPDALSLIERAVQSVRLPAGRFGEPAVYVGTVRDAAGLRFAAVRVVGLAEGHLPPLVPEDPVLPGALRERLGLPGADDGALAALHALDRAVRGAGRRVALSAPRLDLERTQREPSAVLLEAAAALGRPDALTGARGPVIPDPAALRRDAFAPARRAAARFRRTAPLGEGAWQDGVARGALGLPPHWRGGPALDLDRLAALADDGLLGARAAHLAVPGLGPERPLSATALQDLLRCPYLFLHHRMLGLDEPAGAPPRREIGQPAYGSLVHGILEAFFAEHGRAFCAQQGRLLHWLALADLIVEARFAEFLEQYPLAGAAVRGVQRERLRADVHDLLRAEWEMGPRRFVAAEREFGTPEPVRLPAGPHALHVRGTIDRVDADGRRTLVRDFKTGRVVRRLGAEATPDPVGDLQAALYGLVAEQEAARWGTPPAVGVAYVGRHGEVRAFVEDFATRLAPAARDWLALAADLLAARLFPRTPREDDCTFCLLRPVCGHGARERAAAVLDGADHPALGRFRALKGAGGPDEGSTEAGEVPPAEDDEEDAR